MTLLRLLSASLLVAGLPAAVQSAITITVAPTSVQSSPSVASTTNLLIPSVNTALGSLDLSKRSLTAQLNPPCFTLRKYEFTRRELDSSNPHPYRYSTCAPASPNNLKLIVIAPK